VVGWCRLPEIGKQVLKLAGGRSWKALEDIFEIAIRVGTLSFADWIRLMIAAAR
jgi:hypothetical protein